ncbi:hypothetical protein DICPUDRAFT_158583 [Dictyostelium purpureum]|uniref:Uncharacterized protein n=1 Tax=Dictyostelium purpureum TaxID=5786 RepID=F1A1Y8_DICPU|nr:uncharacterized protein DICPUDRAFT_158583 [Dictyostelium purpureum]EGC29798.1 hypothetical protein DICPUDRAFT_158583 [Dictyostelium purpureum]|eukprot:XP_003293684.1 hypothetical protein DICPUDRAFT_158583 [Dictyostelium purpureum]
MLSRTSKLFSTLKKCNGFARRSYGAAVKSAGGAYPDTPGPDAEIVEVEINYGDAIYSYKHQNFVMDPNDINEAVEHMQTLIHAKTHHHHNHGPNCNHDHDHDHHDDHHHHVDPNEIEDVMPRGFFLNKPPGLPFPIPVSLFVLALAGPVIAGMIASYVFDKEEKEEMDRYKENYYRENPEFKELVDKLTKKEYPLSH